MDNKDNINVLKQDDFKLEIYHGKELIVDDKSVNSVYYELNDQIFYEPDQKDNLGNIYIILYDNTNFNLKKLLQNDFRIELKVLSMFQQDYKAVHQYRFYINNKFGISQNFSSNGGNVSCIKLSGVINNFEIIK